MQGILLSAEESKVNKIPTFYKLVFFLFLFQIFIQILVS